MINGLRVRLQGWNAWSRRSVDRRILAGTLTVGGLGFLVRAAIAAKDIAVAHRFGTGDALDAFLIAQLVPSTALNIVGGAFTVSFMPTFIRVREEEGEESAHRLFSEVMAYCALVLVGLTALLALVFPYVIPLVASGFGPWKVAMTRSLFFMLLPSLAIGGIAAAWGAALNAAERFAAASAAPLAAPLLTLTLLLVFGKTLGIHALVAGVLGGAAVETACLSYALKRSGYSLSPRWRTGHPGVRTIAGQFVPVAAGAVVMGGTGLVDQGMAAMLGPGSVAALSYGSKVGLLLQGVASMALGTAVLPHFSRMVAEGDFASVRRTLRKYGSLILKITVPVAAACIVFSGPIVRLLFERGAFTGGDARLVATIQVFYLLEVPFFSLGILAARVISALNANRVLLQGAVVSNVLNVVLNYVFMKWWGVIGIALSTAAVYLVSFGYLSFMLHRLMREADRDGK